MQSYKNKEKKVVSKVKFEELTDLIYEDEDSDEASSFSSSANG